MKLGGTRRAVFVVALEAALAFAATGSSADIAQRPASAPAASAPLATPIKPPAEETGTTLRRLLADPRYAFCHDDHRSLERAEHLCRFAREPVETCPAFARACASMASAPPREPSRFAVPALLASAISALFWTLLVAGVVWCLVQIARHFGESRLKDDVPPSQRKSFSAPSDSAPKPLRVVDKDAARLLAAAKSALAAGDSERTLILAHAALVRALESEGYIRVHASATNGDYARALGTAPVLRDLFRATAREVEGAEFGRAVPPVERLRQLLLHIEPVVQRLVAIAIAIVVVLSASACSSAGRFAGAPDDEPAGNALLGELFEQRGATFERRYRAISELLDDDDHTDLVILAPSAVLDEEDGSTLLQWVEHGGRLMIVGSHPGLPEDFGHRGYSVETCGEPPRAPDNSNWGYVKIVPYERPLHLDSAWKPEVVCDGRPLIATRRYGKGRVSALADPDFLTNASLARVDHAHALLALAGEPDEVSLVDRFVAAGAANPYRALQNSGLAPLLLHGLAWLVVWAVANGATFGVRRDPPEPPRRAFSEHVRAVGRLYARAAANRHALAVYAAWALDRLNARLRAGAGEGVGELGSAIARVTRRPEANVTRILAAAAEARDRPDAPGRAEDLGVLAALDDIVHETGGHR